MNFSIKTLMMLWVLRVAIKILAICLLVSYIFTDGSILFSLFSVIPMFIAFNVEPRFLEAFDTTSKFVFFFCFSLFNLFIYERFFFFPLHCAC